MAAKIKRHKLYRHPFMLICFTLLSYVRIQLPDTKEQQLIFGESKSKLNTLARPSQTYVSHLE